MSPSFERAFAMPNSATFSVDPIAGFVAKHIPADAISVDPFARNSLVATHRNDIDPATAAEHHMDAEAFLAMLAGQGVVADAGIFDPPYSPRQISECYRSIGLSVDQTATQNAALYRRVRDAMDRLIHPGGVVVSFGWNSSGMGRARGYEIMDILLVAHGGAHNDTICLAERKRIAA